MRMDDRAPGKRDVRRVAVSPVLGDRALDVLPGQRVLQLRRRDRDAVHKQREIERLRLVGRVGELTHEDEPVPLVALDELRRQPVRRLEAREPDLDPEVLDPVAEYVHRLRDRLAAVALRQPVSGLRLCRPDEGEHPARVEPELAIEPARIALRVATVLEQPRLDPARSLSRL